MLNNSLRKYQTGGTVSEEDQNSMREFVAWVKNNVKEFKNKSDNEVAEALTAMSKSAEGKKSLQNLFSQYQKSKKSKFADGGKMQQFICKHRRGGVADCGCGKNIPKAAGGEELETRKDGVKGSKSQSTRKDGTVYQTLSRKEPDGTTSYTNLRISPQQDSSFTTYNTRYGIMDNLNSYYPKTQYDNLPWWKRINPFIKVAPQNWIDSFQSNFVESERKGGSVDSESNSPDEKRRQNKRNLWKTINGWFDKEAPQSNTRNYRTYLNPEFKGRGVAQDETEETLPNGWTRVISREWPYIGAQPENVDTVLFGPNGEEFYSPFGYENGGVVMGKQGLSRKDVRTGKRAALKAMNKPTARGQYANLMYKTRNWDEFAGMSRLERKNAINKYILGEMNANGNSAENVTDVESNEAPSYLSQQTYSGVNRPKPAFVFEIPSAPTAPTYQNPYAGQYNHQSSSNNSSRSNVTMPNLGEIVIEEPAIKVPTYDKIQDSDFSYIKPMQAPWHAPMQATESEWGPGELENLWLQSRLGNTESNSNEVQPLSYTPITVDLMKQNFGRYPISGPTWGQGSIYEPTIEEVLAEAQRRNGGPLSPYQIELVRTLYSNPKATINDVHGGWTPETFEAAKKKLMFKRGGKLNK